MTISIEMIEEKEFTTVPKGYDPAEVDEFLDDIVDTMDEMQAEIEDLRNAPAPEPVVIQQEAPRAQSEIQEESIRNMLLNAQRVSDDTISDAKKRAQEMLDTAKREAESTLADAKKRAQETLLKANQQAETIVTDARNEQQQLTEEMETLRAATADYRARFKRLIEDQEHLLKGERSLFDD